MSQPEAIQLQLFDSGKKCDHCKKDPGMVKRYHWNGFKDGDTGQLVCWGCRDYHYSEKAKTENKGLYSEIPVIIHDR